MIIIIIIIMIIITIIITIIVMIIVVTIKGECYKMETSFMNTENSKTNEPNRFRLHLTDKLNLKNQNKNMALANLSIYYTWKNIKSDTITINLKFLLQFGMIVSIYLMDLILLQIFRITLNLSLKNIRH